MNAQKIRLVLFLTILLMLLAERVRADRLGQVTIAGTTYDIVSQSEVKAPVATFKIAGEVYVLIESERAATQPAESPDIPAPTTPPTTQTTQPATQPAQLIRPDPTNTGVPAGVELKPAANLKIQAGNVYEGLSFIRTQTVNLAAGETVTFRNCRIDGNGAPYGVRCDNNLGTVVIDRCEILNVASAAVYGDHFRATSNYIHRSGGDGFKPRVDALIQGNYVSELGVNNPAAHADGVQIRGGENIRIIGNYFDLPIDLADTKSNAALFLQLEAKDVLFDRNWIRGGNYAVHARVDGDGGPTIRITGNVFFSNSVRYGFGSISDGVVWTGNVSDSGVAVKPGDK